MSTDPESGDAIEAKPADSTGDGEAGESHLRWEDCLADAVQYFHNQIDQEIGDHLEGGENPDRAATAREYYNDRGWSDDTIEEWLLGWSPAGQENNLKEHLIDEGYTKEELLATGLFTEDVKPLWHGRYVFPYLDGDGQPVYAIGRCTGNKGGGKAGDDDYDGHPEDFIAGKYGKLAHTKSYACVSEPIFGTGSIRENEPVIITEGIPDAISVQVAGYACLSPVTTQFNHDDLPELLSLLDDYDVPEVYVLQDAERPSVDLNADTEKLKIQQFGEGVKGAMTTAKVLAENGVDVRLNTPPRPGLRKVDVDDYLNEGWGQLDALMASAKPPQQHPAYSDVEQPDPSSPSSTREGSPVASDTDGQSGLFSLDIRDVTSLREGYRGRNPLGHTGNREDYFRLYSDEWAYDHKRKVGYNALTYLLCDAGERSVDSPNGSLSNREMFLAWKHAKENGILPADDLIPHAALVHIAIDHNLCEETDLTDDCKIPLKAYNMALDIVRDEYSLEPGREPYDTDASRSTEDLRRSPHVPDDQSDSQSMTIDKARDRCQQAITQALAQSQYSLIDALPAQGKSRGVVQWAAENDEPLTVLAPRRELLSNEYADWCDEFGLKPYPLPAFHRDCPTARGDHDESWQERVLSLYEAGVTPGEIHGLAEMKFGQKPPCQRGSSCPYRSKQEFDASDYDVLLGHYTHAHREDIIDDRVVVFDETPKSAFIEEFQHSDVETVVTKYLDCHEGIPFENYGELVSDRIDRYRKGDALKWFRTHSQEIRRNGFPVMGNKTEQANAFAALMTYAVLISDDLGNGWEYAELPRGQVAVRNCNPSQEHDEPELYLLMPPSLDEAKRVIGLDGTPCLTQWELCLGTSLTHYQVLSRDERIAYLRDALNLTIYQMAVATKPYSSGTWVEPEKDAILLEFVGKEERQLPDLITSASAISQYEDAEIMQLVNKNEYYGNLKGSNQFSDTRLGVVVGCPHYGDTYVEKWGALAGKAVERVSEQGGKHLDYGSFGNQILLDMREHEVLQALLRFARDGDGGTIYLGTSAIPDWVPITDQGEIRTWSNGMQQLLAVLRDRNWDEWRTSDLLTTDGGKSVLETDDQDPVSERQVRRNLDTLANLGFLDQRKEGCGWVWEDTDLAAVKEPRQVVFTE